jgi:ABC-type sugar transport system ATPase subunit
MDSLSGGNQQKALVGRWMERPPEVLILDEPTRGVDVGAREEIFGIVGGLVEQGMAVLLISSDLEEVLHLAHRVLVYRDGGVVREVRAEEATAEQVMELLTGAAAVGLARPA